jgi:hypothetical protein
MGAFWPVTHDFFSAESRWLERFVKFFGTALKAGACVLAADTGFDSGRRSERRHRIARLKLHDPTLTTDESHV